MKSQGRNIFAVYFNSCDNFIVLFWQGNVNIIFILSEMFTTSCKVANSKGTREL